MEPRTLDELLNLLPGLRRLRAIHAALLRTLLDRRPGECTWCGVVVPKGRREWCGDECVEAFKLRCDPNTMRDHVVKRDRGICAKCGRDTLAAERHPDALALRHARWRLPGESEQEQKIRHRVIADRLRQEFGFARGQWREVDHDPPVTEGGGLCPVDQLRLLCGACHADETKELAGRSAKRSKS